MQTLEQITGQQRDSGCLETASFEFSSSRMTLLANGVRRVLAEPGCCPRQLPRSVLAMLAERSRMTEAGSIVVGAIPFDDRSVCQLYVPASYRFVRRELPRDGIVPAASVIASMREVTDERQYKSAVSEALSLMSSTELRKVVLSRSIDIEADAALDVRAMVDALRDRNPQAYVFAVPTIGGGTLLGASPELLLRKKDDVVVSNPLAGSRPRPANAADEAAVIDELMASDKDRREHALVVEAVAAGLSPFCRTLDVPEAPEVIRTSSMLHLSTRIEGRLADPEVSSLEMALALHPTPAVCGTPCDLARSAISRLEGYCRDQYCGVVGWMDARGDGEWAVSIRCGLLKQNGMRLYAGAGIVDGSEPDSEWDETTAKLNTMLDVFGLRPANDAS
ncbi:isochorismate synthase [Guyparkeria halophila]|uniref:isochorismate synthase n=1 Tax=Guyparkeria halophila TaxID=47960 RepID=A0ABZ0YXA2_9GAMM|nr:isochorismate synthase [Guyparkeria halophila]WQH16673.1 isochorismate synthase [Guyparkeria halophila]